MRPIFICPLLNLFMDSCMCFSAQKLLKIAVKILCRSQRMTELHRNLPSRRTLIDYRLRAAVRFMRKNLSDQCLIEDVARHVGLSRSRFFELFQDQLGTSPQMHWNAIRNEVAISRLCLSEIDITSISLELGFSNPGNFSRFFRDQMGVTPSLYRRNNHAH